MATMIPTSSAAYISEMYFDKWSKQLNVFDTSAVRLESEIAVMPSYTGWFAANMAFAILFMALIVDILFIIWR